MMENILKEELEFDKDILFLMIILHHINFS